MKAMVAVDQSWGIGKDGRLLCHLSADLRRFRTMTMGHPVILGRKTLQTFPGARPLPGRPHLILSRTSHFSVEGAQIFSDLTTLLASAPDDSVIVGGGSVYAQCLPYCRLVHVTKILHTFEADTFFPNLDASPDWTVVEQGEEMEENGIRFQFVDYQRIPVVS